MLEAVVLRRPARLAAGLPGLLCGSRFRQEAASRSNRADSMGASRGYLGKDNMGIAVPGRRGTRKSSACSTLLCLAVLAWLSLTTALPSTVGAQSLPVVDADYQTQDPMSGGCNS